MALPALASGDDLQNAIKTEKNIMLVINELCEKLVPFQPGMERGNEIDLVPVAESLSQCGLSVKQTQRCWEQFKKRLRAQAAPCHGVWQYRSRRRSPMTRSTIPAGWAVLKRTQHHYGPFPVKGLYYRRATNSAR